MMQLKPLLSKLLLWACCVVVICWQHAVEASPIVAKINNVRVSSAKQKTRVVFDLSSAVKYQFFTLNNPYRLVLDLNPLKAPGLGVLPSVRGTAISNIKTSAHGLNRLRVVFALTHAVSPKIFILASAKKTNFRLVIDLMDKPDTSKIADVKSVPVANDKIIHKITIKQPITLNKEETYPIKAKTSAHIQSRPIIIVIDPGHGGKDPGASGAMGHHEKDVVLAIAKDLQKILNQEPGFRAVLTRNNDYFIPLRQRLEIARRYKADMFVAIHADAYRNLYANGASVYALSERGATSEAARWLAEKENYSEFVGGGELPDSDNLLRSVLIDLSQNHTIGVSLQIGNMILGQLSKVTRLHHTRVEQAAFVVLKSPDIPSLLVETGFLSNPQQERQLINPQYQQQLAYAVAQGIKSYFIHNPPPGTIVATKPEPFIHYTVAKGDSLATIAKRYQVSIADLRKINSLKSNYVPVGKTLTIPMKSNLSANA